MIAEEINKKLIIELEPAKLAQIFFFSRGFWKDIHDMADKQKAEEIAEKIANSVSDRASIATFLFALHLLTLAIISSTLENDG